jgi:opacity protein-like surface antigen
MRIRQLAMGFGAACLAGHAFAQTPGAYVTTQAGSLAPFTLVHGQSAIWQMESLGKSYGSAYRFDLGNGFKTEIEGLTFHASGERIGGLAATQYLTSTRLLLKGLYEFSDGSWRVKPYLSAGFGASDLDGHILGLINREWIMAYQVGGGVALDFTQKFMGNLEYRWTNGSSATFALSGVPNTVGLQDHSVVVGVNYKY